MTKIKWGEPLTGPEMKALKLPGDTPVSYRDEHGEYRYLSFFDLNASYRLRADHPYYTVKRYNAEHGTDFVLWLGGENAPDDWDGGRTLVRNGCVNNFMFWSHPWNAPNGHVRDDYDIIGYTRKAESVAANVDSDTVTLKRMTEAEFMAEINRMGDVKWWAMANDLIREETREERFWKSQCGKPVLRRGELVRAALEFERHG